MEIRLINKTDAEKYFILQSDSSIYSKNSFYKSTEEFVSLEIIQKVLNNLSKDNFRLGAFEKDRLIGLICFNRNKFIKLKHKAEIFGFFIYPKYRKQGIGKELLEKAISFAKDIDGLEAITLSVFSESKRAIKLYQKYGFIEIGREKESMKINSTYYDEIYMRLEIGNINR